ncbi:CAT RNA binding domain-containing protein [Lacrimispora xylanisolvens]
MKIEKVLNNNMVLAYNTEGKEESNRLW